MKFLQSNLKFFILISLLTILFVFIGPMVDHLFSTLTEDEKKNFSNYQILKEIILHIILICIIWSFYQLYINELIVKIFNIKLTEINNIILNIVLSILLIGTQKNLLDKINYITFTHPFRLSDIQFF